MKRCLVFVALIVPVSLTGTSAQADHDGPAVSVERPLVPIALGPKGETEIRFFLNAHDAARDLVVRFERAEHVPDAQRVVVYYNVNGAIVSRQAFSDHAFYTLRVPRLFLHSGWNFLRLSSHTDAPLSLSTPRFLSHRVEVGSRAPGEPHEKRLIVWGEPLFEWDRKRVAIWCAVQGGQMQLVPEATVTLTVHGQDYLMAPTKQPGQSALARAVSVGYVAHVPFDALADGAYPASIRASAEGFGSATLLMPLAPPHPSHRNNEQRRTRSRLTTTLEYASDSTRLAFVVKTPTNRNAPKLPTTIDYDGLLHWISETKASGGHVLLRPTDDGSLCDYGDELAKLDFDGLIVHDGERWDPAIKPGGVWDRLLHQRRRIDIDADDPIGAHSDPHGLHTGDIQLTWTIDGVRPGGLVSAQFGRAVEVTLDADAGDSRFKNIRWITNTPPEQADKSFPRGVPGVVVRDSVTSAGPARRIRDSAEFRITRPGYLRVSAETADGDVSVSRPVFIDVRPGVVSRVAHRLGTSSTYQPPPPSDIRQLTLTLDNGSTPLPILLGQKGCRRLKLPIQPRESGHYILELGLDPDQHFDQGGDRLVVALNGRESATYRGGYPIDGRDTEHVVPFRVPLGRLEAGVEQRIELLCDAGHDGIGLAYVYVIRAALPADALTDLHSHAKSEDDWSNLLHRTMGYNYVSTGHGVSDRQLPAARKRAIELSDNQMTIEIGGERGDHFGANHMSLGFHTPGLRGYIPPSSGYGSVLPIALRAGGIASMNHPSQDHRLSFITGEKTWGTNDPYYHGFSGWSHPFEAYGEGDHYWRLLTHFEYLNGYGKIGVASHHLDHNPIPRMRWHEQIGRYCRGERRMPLFGIADTDTKTFQQDSHLTIGYMYMGTYVHAASLRRDHVEAAMLAGNATLGGHADTRLLATLRDAQGRLYQPGNHLIGPGPFDVFVEAWAPRPLAEIRLVGPRGNYKKVPVNSTHVRETIRIESLGPTDWLIVEAQGEEPATGALTNPFLRWR